MSAMFLCIDWINCISYDLHVKQLNIAALPIPCEENGKQLQCSDTEAPLHEQGQQGPYFSFQARQIHAGKG